MKRHARLLGLILVATFALQPAALVAQPAQKSRKTLVVAVL